MVGLFELDYESPSMGYMTTRTRNYALSYPAIFGLVNMYWIRAWFHRDTWGRKGEVIPSRDLWDWPQHQWVTLALICSSWIAEYIMKAIGPIWSLRNDGNLLTVRIYHIFTA